MFVLPLVFCTTEVLFPKTLLLYVTKENEKKYFPKVKKKNNHLLNLTSYHIIHRSFFYSRFFKGLKYLRKTFF